MYLVICEAPFNLRAPHKGTQHGNVTDGLKMFPELSAMKYFVPKFNGRVFERMVPRMRKHDEPTLSYGSMVPTFVTGQLNHQVE